MPFLARVGPLRRRRGGGQPRGPVRRGAVGREHEGPRARRSTGCSRSATRSPTNAFRALALLASHPRQRAAVEAELAASASGGERVSAARLRRSSTSRPASRRRCGSGRPRRCCRARRWRRSTGTATAFPPDTQVLIVEHLQPPRPRAPSSSPTASPPRPGPRAAPRTTGRSTTSATGRRAARRGPGALRRQGDAGAAPGHAAGDAARSRSSTPTARCRTCSTSSGCASPWRARAGRRAPSSRTEVPPQAARGCGRWSLRVRIRDN